MSVQIVQGVPECPVDAIIEDTEDIVKCINLMKNTVISFKHNKKKDPLPDAEKYNMKKINQKYDYE